MTHDLTPHEMSYTRPDAAWLKRQILAYLGTKAPDASDRFAEGMASHLMNNWITVEMNALVNGADTETVEMVGPEYAVEHLSACPKCGQALVAYAVADKAEQHADCCIVTLRVGLEAPKPKTSREQLPLGGGP